MNCKTTLGLLSAYLDRELAPQERDAVRAHLGTCDGCRTEEHDLRALKGLLLGVRAPEPAADFESRLLSRLHAEAASPVRSRLPAFNLRPVAWGQLSGLAAASALATFVVLHGPDTRVTEPSATVTKEVAVRNVDYDAVADRYDAMPRADEFAVGTSLLAES